MRWLARATVLALLIPSGALAQTTEEAQRAQLELLRREVANEVQLAAFNLVDELIYGWTKGPVFEEPTAVVLAGVTVPVGLGTALQALLENHISSVLLKNPATNLVLSHCPSCTAIIVHSGPEGTVISRGVDNPEALERFKTNATKYALFIDVEAEGTWLVLRTRITRLDRDLAIVWARTISSAASAPSMLRQANDLKSAEEARTEYTDALNDRWPLNLPIRLAVRIYDDGQSGAVNPPPYLWIETGVELSLSQARAWTGSILLGYGFVPSQFDGFMGQLRVNRLLTGTSRSFVAPDLYGFVGASIFATSGPAAQIFAREQPTTEEIIALANGDQPTQIFTAIHTGIELRIGNRLGAAIFGESLPAHIGSDNLTTYLGIFHSLGTEIAIWF